MRVHDPLEPVSQTTWQNRGSDFSVRKFIPRREIYALQEICERKPDHSVPSVVRTEVEINPRQSLVDDFPYFPLVQGASMHLEKLAVQAPARFGVTDNIPLCQAVLRADVGRYG